MIWELLPVLGFALACFGAAAISAAPVELYVAPDGEDEGPGTWSQPCASLERGAMKYVVSRGRENCLAAPLC